MSVKIEVIEAERRFKIRANSTQRVDFQVEVNESEAREIYDGLAGHFRSDPVVTYSGSALALLDAKDAEIARLREWLEKIERNHTYCVGAGSDARKALDGEKVPE